MKRLISLLAVSAVLLLTACGGGGGCAGTPTNGTNTCTSSGPGPGGTTPTGSAQLIVVITDSAGTPLTTNAITSGAIFFAQATLVDAAGAPTPNQIVTFSTDTSIGSLSPSSALTNASGVAKVQLSPASLSSSGAATLTASASGASGQTAYQTGASNVVLSAVTVTPATISALQTASVSTNVTVNGIPATAGQVTVTLSAGCGYFSTPGVRSISVPTASGGVASATWQSESNCGGATVNLAASASGATTTTGTVAVAVVAPANILYGSATATTLVVSSATSGTKQSTVSFKVVDSVNTGMANQSVTISLDSQSVSAGVSFSVSGTFSTANQVLMTDANGMVNVTIQSGALPTPVVVTAVLTATPTMKSTSSGIIVTSGKPSQNYASLAAVALNLEGLNRDGVTTDVTMRVADRTGNPVPVGTAVTFMSSIGGFITGSCLTNASSTCVVVFTTSGARPSDGMVTLLAYMDGEESFIDTNGNNIWDAGETFYDMGQAFRDDNHNRVYDPSSDQLIGSLGGGTLACPSSTPALEALAYPSVTNTCDGTWTSSIRVRKSLQIGLSSDTASITPVAPAATVSGFTVYIADGTPGSVVGMATGTTVSATIGAGGVGCAVSSVSPATVRNQPLGGDHFIALNGNAGCSGARIDVKVTSPTGVSTIVPFTI